MKFGKGTKKSFWRVFGDFRGYFVPFLFLAVPCAYEREKRILMPRAIDFFRARCDDGAAEFFVKTRRLPLGRGGVESEMKHRQPFLSSSTILPVADF